MENLTEAQRHLYNILDEELAVMEHPSVVLAQGYARSRGESGWSPRTLSWLPH